MTESEYVECLKVNEKTITVAEKIEINKMFRE